MKNAANEFRLGLGGKGKRNLIYFWLLGRAIVQLNKPSQVHGSNVSQPMSQKHCYFLL